MKLRNKKTGAIYKIEDIDLGNNSDGIWLGMTKYNSLAELNEEWEDYSELRTVYSVLGEAAASLYFEGYSILAEKVRNLQSEVGEYL